MSRSIEKRHDIGARVLEPTGVGRGTTFVLLGHAWARDPYVAGEVPSQRIGKNRYAMYLGSQESVTPNAHFDVVIPRAGGTYGARGTYLFRDQGSFGILSGLWGLIEVY